MERVKEGEGVGSRPIFRACKTPKLALLPNPTETLATQVINFFAVLAFENKMLIESISLRSWRDLIAGERAA